LHSSKMAEVGNQGEMVPSDKWAEIVLNFDQNPWWWAINICLSAIAVVANLIFIVTVVHNRRRHELKTFVTAVIVTIAVLDIVDVVRILPVLSETVFKQDIFRHVYYSLGVFHELAIAIFLVSISVAVCVQAGKESKLYNNDPRTSLAHKILIPVVLLIAAGAAAPLFLLKYEKVSKSLSYSGSDPVRMSMLILGGVNEDQDFFHYDLYSTVVTVFTYVLPLLVLPLALPIATLRTCISRQCCVMRFKQPIGELIMTTIVCLIYLGTIICIMLPKIDKMDYAKFELEKAPLLWELGNNAVRPVVYFMTNPAVWDGLSNLCCRKKNQLVNEDEEEAELPLAPVTTV